MLFINKIKKIDFFIILQYLFIYLYTMINISIEKNNISKSYLIDENIKRNFPYLIFFKMIEYNDKYNIENQKDENNNIIFFLSDEEFDQDIFDAISYPILKNCYDTKVYKLITLNNIEAINDQFLYLQLCPLLHIDDDNKNKNLPYFKNISKYYNLLLKIDNKFKKDIKKINLYEKLKLFMNSYSDKIFEGNLVINKENQIGKINNSLRLFYDINCLAKESIRTTRGIFDTIYGTCFKLKPNNNIITISKIISSNELNPSNINYVEIAKFKYEPQYLSSGGECDYAGELVSFKVNIEFFNEVYEFKYIEHIRSKCTKFFETAELLNSLCELKRKRFLVESINGLLNRNINNFSIKKTSFFTKGIYMYVFNDHVNEIFPDLL